MYISSISLATADSKANPVSRTAPRTVRWRQGPGVGSPSIQPKSLAFSICKRNMKVAFSELSREGKARSIKRWPRKLLSRRKTKDADDHEADSHNDSGCIHKGRQRQSPRSPPLWQYRQPRKAAVSPCSIGSPRGQPDPLVADARQAGQPAADQRRIEPAAAVRKLAGECDWLFLDTAPAMMDQVELAVQAADFVLIPVLASAFDLMAARAVVALCGEHARRSPSCSIARTPAARS